ncbi:unnamed protein product [Linum tenue]|uniref:Uncharacterized protein n=1 Tax=Linum tenue TaxID=586396 RepID=A0AAV0GZZ2_9ROSI|nr:unnamed protein product [Linum tenue]
MLEVVDSEIADIIENEKALNVKPLSGHCLGETSKQTNGSLSSSWWPSFTWLSGNHISIILISFCLESPKSSSVRKFRSSSPITYCLLCFMARHEGIGAAGSLAAARGEKD